VGEVRRDQRGVLQERRRRLAVTAPSKLSHLDILRARLRTQRLLGDPFATPADAVDDLVAVQAQEYVWAKWAIGMRTAGCADADVESAVADGTLLRTHVLRPTWHFVRPRDIRWLLRLTGPRIVAGTASRRRELGLDDRTLDRACETIAGALRAGRHLTRRELAPELEESGIDTAGQRLAHIVGHAELTGLLCSGPPRGKQQTYALLDERAPGPEGPSGDDALAELALRFVRSHGPATVHDLAWWATLRVSDARRAIDLAAGGQLQSFELEGKTYWHAGIPDGLSGHREALLLPDYDESYVGYRSVRSQTRGGAPETALPSRPVVVDGELVATWKRTPSRDGAVVSVDPAVPLSRRDTSAIEAAVGKLAAFAGTPMAPRIG
jgi:hypothetical protein